MTNISATTDYTFATLSPEQVYDAWLEPALVQRWMTRNLERIGGGKVTRVEINPVIGGTYRFAGVQDGQPSDSWGSYRELDRGRRLVFTWFIDADEEREDNSTVTLALTPDGQGTHATMSHEMDSRWADYAPQTANAWRGMLEAIDETLSQTPTG